MNGRRIDWFKVALHFVSGGILGGIVGLGFWAYFSNEESGRDGIIWIAGGGALLAAYLTGFRSCLSACGGRGRRVLLRGCKLVKRRSSRIDILQSGVLPIRALAVVLSALAVGIL
jgi:hypothetical protein